MNEEFDMKMRVDALVREVAVLRRVVLFGFVVVAILLTCLFWPLAPALLAVVALVTFVCLLAYPLLASVRTGVRETVAEIRTKHES